MNTLFLLLTGILYLSLAVNLIWSRVHIGIKACLILATILVTLLDILVLIQAQGTPSQIGLPSEFLLSSILVREPEVQKHDVGAVYYVIIEVQNHVAAPRVYERPYSKNRHKNAAELQESINKQQGPVWVHNPDEEGGASGEGSGSRKNSKTGSNLLKKLSRGFGYYDDDSESNLQVQEDLMPSKE